MVKHYEDALAEVERVRQRAKQGRGGRGGGGGMAGGGGGGGDFGGRGAVDALELARAALATERLVLSFFFFFGLGVLTDCMFVHVVCFASLLGCLLACFVLLAFFAFVGLSSLLDYFFCFCVSLSACRLRACFSAVRIPVRLLPDARQSRTKAWKALLRQR